MAPARFKNRDYAVGVDIGASDIRLVVLSGGDELTPTVEKLIVTEYSDGSLVHTLRELWKEVDVPVRGAKCALGTCDVIVHQVEFPEMAPEELRSAARIEAEQLMPNSGEMVIDFQELAREPDDKGLIAVRMLIVAAAKSDVMDRRELMREAHVPVLSVVPDGIALANALSNLYPAGSGGIVGVDVVQGGTNVVVMKLDDRDTPPVVRHIACGVEDMPVGEKQETPTDTFGGRRQSGERWLREVERSMSFASEKMGGMAGGIAMVGECAARGDVCSWIENNLQLSVTPWNPIKELPLGSNAPDREYIERYGAQGALAVGLALMEES